MPTKDEIMRDSQTAEALSRRAESEANVFRSLSGPPKPEDYQGPHAERAELASRLGRRAAELGGPYPIDPEGTAYPMADRRGNYAEDADTANQGGVGVFDSNSRKLEAGEGTPSTRLNPEIVRGEQFAPSVEQSKLEDLFPEGGEVTVEDQEEADRQRAIANVTGMVHAVGSSEDEPRRRGRPPGSKNQERAPAQDEVKAESKGQPSGGRK